MDSIRFSSWEYHFAYDSRYNWYGSAVSASVGWQHGTRNGGFTNASSNGSYKDGIDVGSLTDNIFNYHRPSNVSDGVVNIGGWSNDYHTSPTDWPANLYGLFLSHDWPYSRVVESWSSSRLSKN